MDPIVIAILTLFVLATGGTATAAVRRRKRTLARLGLQQDMRAARRLEDHRLSLFDVFWDLGASDFALELMAHHDLLPTQREAVHGSWSRLSTLVEQHGSYEAFLEDSLEAIQEFFIKHKQAGHRRRLPGLTEASAKTIPVPRITAEDAPTAEPVPEGPSAREVRERRALRMGRQDPGNGMMAAGTYEEINLDRVGNLSATDLLMGVVDGSLGDRLEAWWKQRRLRQHRQRLDEALERLYDFYADVARRTPAFYEPPYDAHLRWQDEATRLRQERHRRPWKNETWALAADVLYDDGIALSERLSQRAYESTYRAIEAIHDYARRGDRAMAGYLVFLNRHAFFAGRHQAYVEHCREVEFATARLSEEILRLRDQGSL